MGSPPVVGLAGGAGRLHRPHLTGQQNPNALYDECVLAQ